MKKLTGKKSLCRGCGEYFTGEQSFDAHRVGTYEPLARRCLTVTEMRVKGFAKDDKGFWMTPYDVKRYPERVGAGVQPANGTGAIGSTRAEPLPPVTNTSGEAA